MADEIKTAAVSPVAAPDEPAGSAWSRALTIVCGVFLVAVLTPLSQFLTMMTLTADVEVATPVGWAVGAVVSLVIVVAVLRGLMKVRVISRASLVLLYCMLTIAAPLMNIGLIRTCYLSMFAAVHEYVIFGSTTHRTLYNSLHPNWFPVVPTNEGLVWNKADRLLQLLTDTETVKRRLQAQREVSLALSQEARRLEQMATGEAVTIQPLSEEQKRELAAQLGRLGLDQLTGLRAAAYEPLLRELGLTDEVDRLAQERMTASREAAERLPGMLRGVDEYEASLLSVNMARMDESSVNRLRSEQRTMTGEQRAEWERRVSALEARASELIELATRLGQSDYARVRSAVEEELAERVSRMSAQEVRALRHSFVFRLPVEDRREMAQQDGRGAAPNQNLRGVLDGVWLTSDQKRQAEQRTFMENLQEAAGLVPWQVWFWPVCLWGLLFTCIFLFLMCLAEWLRRKWVERENLAFPLVEVIDNVIRHDRRLETASDVTTPEPRQRVFNMMFLAGCVIGFGILSVEAMGHYQLLTKIRHIFFFNVSEQVLTAGLFKELDRVYFVLSPIVVGLLFLVSLEISFSIWVIFIVYSLVTWAVRISGMNLVDPLYTGWAGGRMYPFPAEQLMGASMFFTAVTLWKTWRGSGSPVTDTRGAGPGHGYMPTGLTRAGLMVMPLAIAGLLWHMGVTNLMLLVMFGGLVLILSIAATRARAETGLYTHHVTYEFTKLPMVFGLTGMTGAAVYTRFITVAFLPVTLLFRTLPQQLENIELARRNRLSYRLVAVAGLTGFLAALVVGLVSFLVLSYYFGADFFGAKVFETESLSPFSIAHYPLWISHFLGEPGLDKFTEVHWIRVWFIVVGLVTFGLLYYLRNRFIRFPLHPLGYLLILLSFYFTWVTPYARGGAVATRETSWLWGSAFLAWLLKKLIVKYGGMNTYKRAKPFFVGLVVGSVFAIFAWNATDLVCSLLALRGGEPSAFIKAFTGRSAFSSWVY